MSFLIKRIINPCLFSIILPYNLQRPSLAPESVEEIGQFVEVDSPESGFSTLNSRYLISGLFRMLWKLFYSKMLRFCIILFLKRSSDFERLLTKLLNFLSIDSSPRNRVKAFVSGFRLETRESSALHLLGQLSKRP
jgi:hypothetical protein